MGEYYGHGLQNVAARATSSNIISLLDFSVFREPLAKRGDYGLLVLKANSGKQLEGEKFSLNP
jgi:hypothetical protein